MGMCRPKTASSTVRINGQRVVRHDDFVEMNCAGADGPSNTLGRVMYVPVGLALAVGLGGECLGDTDPPVEPETKEERGWAARIWDGVAFGAEQYLGFQKGMRDGLVDTVVGVKDLAVGAFWMGDLGRAINPARSAQAHETFRTTVGAIWDDPGLLWDGIKEPYVEAWSRGAYGEAIGRGTLEAVLAVVGTKGADKAAKGATAASRAAGAVDDVARAGSGAADNVAGAAARGSGDAGRLADDAGRAADGAAGAAASGADDMAQAGSDGIQILGDSSPSPSGLQFWDKPRDILGRRVYRRNDLFDPDRVSSWKERGKPVSGTNLERMASGRAPIGHDGKPVDLHHLIQREPGPMAEVSYTMHKGNHGTLHTPDTPSFRRNPALDRQFNAYRSDYWKSRASTYPD